MVAQSFVAVTFFVVEVGRNAAPNGGLVAPREQNIVTRSESMKRQPPASGHGQSDNDVPEERAVRCRRQAEEGASLCHQSGSGPRPQPRLRGGGFFPLLRVERGAEARAVRRQVEAVGVLAGAAGAGLAREI